MDTRDLRYCFGRFATGVTVVTYRGESKPMGITVNSFTSVSLDPPLVLVSIDKKTKSHDLLQDRSFTVNILNSEQEDVAWQFAGRPQEDLAMEWQLGDHAPRIKNVLAYLECRPWKAYDGGDHTLYLGEVVNYVYNEGNPLGFYCGKFHTISV